MRNLTGISCIGYCRVSTERQAGEKQTSLADQRSAITTRATKDDLVVGEWFVDAGASGGTAEGRSEFMAMLASCEASRRSDRAPGTLLVLNDSRWGRFADPEESAFWRIRFAKVGWVVRYVENDESDNTTVRTLMRAIGGAQASEYREQLKKNSRRGMRGTAEQGFWTREAPFGYRRRVVYPPGRERPLDLGVAKARDEKVALVPHEEEAAIVRLIFERYVSGEYSLGGLAHWLQERIPSKPWTRRLVQAILKSETYCGDVPGGRRTSTANGKLVRTTSDHWYGMRDAHPALVSRDLFARAQERMRQNTKRYTRGASGGYLLSGLVTCTTCDAPYIGGGIGGRVRVTPTTPDGKSWFYKCSAGVKGPPYAKLCLGPVGTIARNKLESAVVGALSRELSKPTTVRLIESEIDRALTAKLGSGVEELENVRASLSNLERKRDRLVALVADEKLLPDEAAAQLAPLRADLAALKAREEVLRFEERRQTIDPATREAIVRLALDFPRVAQSSTRAALRELVRPWLAFARFDKNTRCLTLGIRRLPSLAPFLATSPQERD